MTAQNVGNVSLQDRGRGNLRVLQTCTQSSTDQSFDDSGVENVNRSVGAKMTNGIVLGACSR